MLDTHYNILMWIATQGQTQFEILYIKHSQVK